VVRDRLSYRRQLQAATAAGKASAMLVALIGPAIFLFFFFFRPDYVQTMLESPLGQTALIVAAFMELVGLIWVARLVRPAY
jgi:Flp pilus assembly protein TadB